MKRVRSYVQFRETRPIKEEFLGKFWRGLTGKNKERIEAITKQIKNIADILEDPKTSADLSEVDPEIAEAFRAEMTKIVESSEWRKKIGYAISAKIKEDTKISEEQKIFFDLLINYIRGEKPDFEKVEEMDEKAYSRMKPSDSEYGRELRQNIIGVMSAKWREISKSLATKALSKLSEREEFMKACESEAPSSKLIGYYLDEIYDGGRNFEEDPSSQNFELNKSGEAGGVNIARLVKSFAAFLGKKYNKYDYDKSKPEILEKELGKEYLDRIDLGAKISSLEIPTSLVEDLKKVIKWQKETNKSIKKMESLKNAFEGIYHESDFKDRKYSTELYLMRKNECLLALITWILKEYGEMSISQFFDRYNSISDEKERFTTTEEYFEGREIYRIKEGCGKAYHGGKIPNDDLDFLFRENGGMYFGKLATAAARWPGVINSRSSGKINSVVITRRVYEISIKPETKMLDFSPSGADGGAKGGLRDEKAIYGGVVEGLAFKKYMNLPDGADQEGNKEYKESVLQSEIVIFDRKSAESMRIVPYKEVISEFERLGMSGDDQYKKLKEDYKTIRNLVWSLESSKSGRISGLESFSKIDERYALENIGIKSANLGTPAPEGDKADELVEKCGSISVSSSEIVNFPTLLDMIIFYHGK